MADQGIRGLAGNSQQRLFESRDLRLPEWVHHPKCAKSKRGSTLWDYARWDRRNFTSSLEPTASSRTINCDATPGLVSATPERI